MEQDRVVAIREWPAPKSVHDLQVFLGFANFYRRFVQAYARLVHALTNLLRKNIPFLWNALTQDAFDALKDAFTTAPILRHFDPDKEVIMHTDASGFAISGIVSQLHEGRLHPVAFWSRKCSPAECNYDTHDREMLAIVCAMRHWRHYVEGAKHQVKVYADHKNLEYFMSTKILTRRQARWAETLSSIWFVLVYSPGVANPADGPSRRPDYHDDSMPAGMLLRPDQVVEAPIASVLAVLAITTVEDELRAQFIQALSTDPFAIDRRASPLPQDAWEDGLFMIHGRFYVPPQLRLEICRLHHDSKAAGHYGFQRTLELLSRDYVWDGMSSYVKEYVSTCETCTRAKPSRHRQHGELMPLPVPSQPWKGLSCDFVTDLPRSQGFDSLLVFCCRLTKMIHVIPCLKTTNAEQFAKLVFEHVVKLHGLPDSIVSDRGSIFTSGFWSSLALHLGVKRKLSTAFHPQTDGQTERMNQTIEQYLRVYCNHQQDDWVDLLPLAEFTYNNSRNSTTGVSPFYANYGYHPRLTVNLKANLTSSSSSKFTVASRVPTATEHATRIQQIHATLVNAVTHAQDHQAKYYDSKHKSRSFNVGDKVWLSTVNLRTIRPSKKLDQKRVGPFKILAKLGLQAYRLELPNTMRQIHDVFHVSLLDPAKENTIPDRIQSPPPPVILDNEAEFEVEEVLDSKVSRRRLFYLVKWLGYPSFENSWEPASNLKHTSSLIAEFHRKYPSKPCSAPPR